MAAFHESRLKKRILTYFRLLAAVSLAILVLTSCSRPDVYVLSDPHIDILSGGKWRPAGFGFRVRGVFNGFRVYPVTVEDDDHLRDILENLLPDGGVLVVSPFSATDLPPGICDGRRVIIPGAGSEGLPGCVETIGIDRNDSFAEIGDSARNFTDGNVLAVFNSSTAERKREKGSFIDGFVVEPEDSERLTMLELTETTGGTLPENYISIAENAELLVLLAGPENIPALLATEEKATPVMGEYLLYGGISTERIICSVEDDPGAMLKTLMKVIRNGEDGEEKSYQTQVSRK